MEKSVKFPCMKRSLLILLFFVSGSLSLLAQTNFPIWHEFRSDRFRFTIQYPDAWTVNEQANGVYVFRNQNQSLGTYTVVVDENTDSVTAYNKQLALKDENKGSMLSQYGKHSLLTYKTLRIKNGVDEEIHHWVIAVNNRLFIFSYAFPTHLRNATQLVDEMTMAYQIIEMVKFID